MFSRIGKKIMKLAKVICWFGIVCSVLLGASVIAIGFMPAETAVITETAQMSKAATLAELNKGMLVALGVFVAAVGSLGSWIGSWLLYAFGDMAENLRKMAERY